MHVVGNKHNEEALTLSEAPLDASDENLRELLLRYFLSHFEQPEYWSFRLETGENAPNAMYGHVRELFADPAAFHACSQDVARYLYDCARHPNIKPGELYVVLLTDLVLEDELTDAIGFFKSESRHSFLKVLQGQNGFSMTHEQGIDVEKLDKGCLVFRLSEKEGYKVCILDKSSRSTEAQYWRDDFLGLQACTDNYHYTRQFLNTTKRFVASKLADDFQVDRSEQIDFLNKSLDYFKNNDQLQADEFADAVFGDKPEFKASFHTYRQEQAQDSNLLSDEFGISSAAVKRQERAMRSVLKLDKNFHVYIHGDRELIEKGFDEERGKSFYKIFFDEEN
jgi:hypothetical protein